MGTFRKSLEIKTKKSKQIEENLKKLNDELKKTGALDNIESVDILAEDNTAVKFDWRSEFFAEKDSTNITEELESLHETVKKKRELRQLQKVDEHLSNIDANFYRLRDELIENINQEMFPNIPALEEKLDEILTVYGKLNKRITEGFLNEPTGSPQGGDPLAKTDFVTFDQLKQHYSLFLDRISTQLATLGGGGETQLMYLDDVVGIATNPSAYDGKYLKYDHATRKFVFSNVPSTGITTESQTLNSILGLGNTSNYGLSVGVSTITELDVTNQLHVNVGIALSPPPTEELYVIGTSVLVGNTNLDGDVRIAGILTVGTSSITLDGTNNSIGIGSVSLDEVKITQLEDLTGQTGNFGGDVSVVGVVTATSFYGDGSNLTGLSVGVGTTTISTNSIVVVGVVTAASFSGNATSATYATSAGIATYAVVSGISTYATTAGIATIATYASTSGIATYATTAGIATNATSAVTSGYASIAGIASVAQALTGTPNIVVGNVTAVDASFSGNVSIAGTLSYVSLTNLDSIGIITARNGILIGSPISIGATLTSLGDAIFSGIITASSFSGNATSATYATNAGTATYANTAGISAFAVIAGVATAASTVDILNTNGLTTVYYPTFVESRTDGQIVRADVDLTYRTDTNTLTVPNVSATTFVGALTGNATSATYASNSGIATYASTAGIATYATSAGIATYSTSSGVSTYATTAGVSTYSTTSGVSTYADTAGVSTYSATSGVSTYATSAGIATFATTAGSVSYASTSGISTVSQGLVGSPNITVGVVTANTAEIKNIRIGTYGLNNVFGVSGPLYLDSEWGQVDIVNSLLVNGIGTFSNRVGFRSDVVGLSSAIFTGIVTAQSFKGDGSGLTGIAVSMTLDQLSDVNVSSPAIGEVLKWNGSQWVSASDLTAAGGAGIGLTNLSVTVNSPGISTLTYSNVTGVFTYTPPNLSSYLTSSISQNVLMSNGYVFTYDSSATARFGSIGDSNYGDIFWGTSGSTTGLHIENKDADGGLYLTNTGTGGAFIRATSTKLSASFIPNNAANLYYDNALKFSTTGVGVTVFGELRVNSGIVASGIITATEFKGTFTGTVSFASVAGVASTANFATSAVTAVTATSATTATTASGLTGTPAISVGTITCNDDVLIQGGTPTLRLQDSDNSENYSYLVYDGQAGPTLFFRHRCFANTPIFRWQSEAGGSIGATDYINIYGGAPGNASEGYVGLWTNSPTERLHVVGSTRITQNLNVAGIITATGGINGSGVNLTGIVTSIVAGTGITISSSTGVVTINATATGINTTQTLVTGNIQALGVVTATTFIGAVTGNVTGNATGLSGTPNITVGTIAATSLNVSGIVTATQFKGDGSGLTGIVASGTGVVIQDEGGNIGTAGTINFVGAAVTATISSGVALIQIANHYSNIAGIATYATTAGVATNAQGLTGTPNLVVGVVTATSFKGDGSQLTGIATASGKFIDNAAGIHTTSAVGIKTDLPKSDLQVARYGVSSGIGTFIAVVSTEQIVDQFNVSTSNFRTAEYTLHIQHANGIQAQKVLVMQDEITAYSNEFAIMYTTSNPLVSVSSTISSGVCQLRITPQTGVTGITTYRFSRETLL